MKALPASLRRVGRQALMAVLLLLLAFSALLWYITTASFQELVRQRLVQSLERTTGGRVEVGGFAVRPLRLELELRDLTIHGRETAKDKPYLHVESLTAVVKISSALGAKLAFHSLTLRRPVIHLIFYPDGTTNQPAPAKIADTERLLSFSIDHLWLDQGELIWQDQQIPLDFRSQEVSARLNYSLLRGRYSGELTVGRAETNWDGYRPLAWAGRALFTIDRKGIEVQSLDASAGHSRVQLRSVLLDPAAPSLKASYDLALNLRDLGALSRRTELKSGTVELQGDGSWSARDFRVAGGFRARELAWQDKRFSLPELTMEGKFAVDPERFSLTKIEGQMLKGSFSAQAEIDNWRSPTAEGNRVSETGSVRIKTRDLSLAEILLNLGPRYHPLNRLRFSGELSASSELRWKDSPGYGRFTTELEISPPARPASGLAPVTASAQLSYDLRSRALQIRALSLETPSSQVHASGEMSSTGSLRLALASNQMSEWQPVESLVFPEGAPFIIQGRASFDGTTAGALPEIRIRGRLASEDFDLFLPTAKGSERWHWDALRADLEASRSGLALHNAVLDRGGARVSVNGTAELVGWRHLLTSPFNFQVDVQNADAHELARLSGYQRELSGTLSASFTASGTRVRPQARGSAHLAAGALEGISFDTASARFAFSGTQLSFTDFNLERRQSAIRGGGSYDLASRAFRFDLQGTNFDLAEIAPLERSRIRIAGKLDFSARGSGTTSSPEFSADLNLRGLTFNQENEGDLKLNAVAHGSDLRLTGHSAFKTAELTIGGQVQLRALWPAHIDFHFARLDVDPVVESYLHGQLTGHSAVSGDLALDGPLRDPKRLSLTGTLTALEAQVDKIQLHNQGPVQFSLANQIFKIDALHVVGPNTDVSAQGGVELAGDRRLDLVGRGKIDLKLLEAYDPDFTSSGEVTGEARIEGTLLSPQVKGSFDIQNGAIADINVPTALSDINGRLGFSQKRVTIENLRARSGGGTLTFTGYAEINGSQLNFNLAANADSVRLRYPPGVSSTADAQLRWSGSSSASVISGDITVTKLGFTPGFDFGAYLERTAQVAALPQTDPVLNRIRLDLHVVTTPELQMQTSVIRLQGEADLRVRGSAAKPVLLGRADIFEGEAYFEGTKYRLERGGVTFANPVATTPFLDVEATTHVRDYDITLSLSGEIGNGKQPRLNYRSEPPLPPADIISLLAFGQTSEQSAQLQEQSQSAFSQQASSAMLAAALNATLNNRAQRLFGNSRIKIDPQGLETYTSSTTQYGPAVTIEQQVQDNLTVSYTTSVAQTSQQVIRSEYNFSHNLSIVAIRDQNGVVSFDIKIRRRKR